MIQVISVTWAHHTIYSNWIKPFDACVTAISICFHSGWHYRCPVCDVMLCKNKWEILMITSPLLSNVRHRAMITPVSPPLTRLIHIRASCWSIYCSFEIILEMRNVHCIELQIQCSIQIHCFNKTFSPIWIMLYQILICIALLGL